MNFEAHLDKERFRLVFGVEPPERPLDGDLWPGSTGAFLRVRPQSLDGVRPDSNPAAAGREAMAGLFGLLPHWAKDPRMGRRTVNARAETAAQKPAFRDAWRRGQRCIVPATAIYEPDWSSGRPVSTRLGRHDGRPFGMAGLWDAWSARSGESVLSFTLLTIDAAGHELMRRFHRPGKEKRMVVVLDAKSFDEWLRARPDDARRLLVPLDEGALAVLGARGEPGTTSKARASQLDLHARQPPGEAMAEAPEEWEPENED
ncbi:MAG: SOS response-associated peptidase [Polyangia bacterium]|nr:SOS response-associated peptidase [Polyangia bacterium]